MVVVAYFSVVIERPGIIGPASITVSMVMMAIVSTAITRFELVVVMI